MSKEFKQKKEVKKPKSDKPKDKTPKYMKLQELTNVFQNSTSKNS